MRKLGFALSFVAVIGTGCVQLVPNLDFELDSPLGGVGMGVDEGAPDVVSSSGPLGLPDDVRAVGSAAHDDVLDERLRDAIARATGTLESQSRIQGPPAPQAEPPFVASSSPQDTTRPDDASELQPIVPRPGLRATPTDSAAGEADRIAGAAADDDGQALASPQSAENRGEQAADGEPTGAEAGAPPAAATEPTDAQGNTAESEAGSDLRVDAAQPDESAAPVAQQQPTGDQPPAPERSEPEPEVSTSGGDPASQGALDSADAKGKARAAGVDASEPQDGVASEAASRPGPSSVSSTYSDLGYWYDRPLVTAGEVRIGDVYDLRVDLAGRSTPHLLVDVPQRRWPLPWPGGMRQPFVVSARGVADLWPVVDWLTIDSLSGAKRSARPEYRELVAQAFASSEPQPLTGAVLGIDRIQPEDGPVLVVVKLRDGENLLHRVDIGPARWFEGTDELPEEGEELSVLAVPGRDERGQIWHVARITSTAEPLVLRDSEGAALRPDERPDLVIRSTWSLRKVLGTPVHLASEPTETANPTAEVAVVAGLLMHRETKRTRYALLRPSVDSEDGFWLVPLPRLQPRVEGPWLLNVERARLESILLVGEDDFALLDVAETHEAVRAFWGMPERDGKQAVAGAAAEGASGD